ncbi:MAG TPA: GNAT family N-acetyltransferase, partial [Chromatiaceae bacterium]|nr:GNAT family N-acetyltransferase [Chromatiaceae bacterium]
MELSLAPLGKQHDRKSFDCGEASLDQYLIRYASQDIKRGVNRVFVASPLDTPRRVIGYYSL